MTQPEALVSELQEEFVLDVRGASLVAIEEAALLRKKSRELRAESKRLQMKSHLVNYYATAVARRATELSINLVLA